MPISGLFLLYKTWDPIPIKTDCQAMVNIQMAVGGGYWGCCGFRRHWKSARVFRITETACASATICNVRIRTLFFNRNGKPLKQKPLECKREAISKNQ